MGPYSHFILAAKLAPYMQPQDPGEYYWGSIVPDIRYLARMRRDHTHLSQNRLNELAGGYPHLKSFLLGYRVHCLIDEIDVSRRVSAAFPLNIIKRLRRKNFSQQQMTMLVEMHYQQSASATGVLSGSHNEVLDMLGVTSEQSGQFSQAMREYFHSHSFDAAVSTFREVGIIENTRLEKYLGAYDAMKKNRLMTAFLLTSVRNARLEAYTVDYVRSGIQGK